VTTLIRRFTEKYVPGDEIASCQMAVEKAFPQVTDSVLAVDVAALATEKQIALKYQDIVAYDGALSWDSSQQATITVSTRSNWKRQRFTIAHELGHWILQENILGKTSEPLFRGLSTNRREVQDEERLANLLAAEILLPKKAVLFEASRNKPGLEMVRALVNRFATSRIAALRRMADIFGRRMLFLNVVPTYFNNLSSPAEIDEAIYFRPCRGTLSAREETRIVDKMPYSEIATLKNVHLSIKGVEGVYQACFDVSRRNSPVPNCDLLAIDSI
jgi:Zn-dependent peptidase ImmA (M78 family)